MTDYNSATNKVSTSLFIGPFAWVLGMWLVYWMDDRFSLDLTRYGVYPLTAEGLWGIVFSPLLHGSLSHLASNTLPVLVLGSALNYFYRPIHLRIWFLAYLLPSVGVWLFARPAFHIGASGVIYALAFFLLASGIFRKNRDLQALALLVVFLYGGLTWGLFPFDPQISWEAHTSGAVTGLVLAVVFRNKGPAKPEPVVWEEDDLDTWPLPEDDPDPPHPRHSA